MKHIKKFEDSFYDEYPFIKKPENRENVPGFEDGTIDPEDDKEEYQKFLKIVKDRNFKETQDEIVINIEGVVSDFCMSIYNYGKYLLIFLKNELINKYISNGFINILSENFDKHEGIIVNIIKVYQNDFDCSMLFNLKLKDVEFDEDGHVSNIITIDKLKTAASKFNI